MVQQKFFTIHDGVRKDDHEQKNPLSLIFIFHHNKALPLITDDIFELRQTEHFAQTTIKVRRYDFSRLARPYETQCHDYGLSDRSQCLNQCYEKQYILRLKCIPFDNSLYSFDYNNDTEFNAKTFCLSNDRKLVSETNCEAIKSCDSQCRTPCSETLFTSESFTRNSDFDDVIAVNKEYRNIIEYLVRMSLFDLMITAINLINSWYGTTLIDLIVYLKNYLKLLITNTYIDIRTIRGSDNIIRYSKVCLAE